MNDGGGEITEADDLILKALRKEIQELIEQRNRIMHDAWMNTIGGGMDSHPMSTMRVRVHGKGAEYERVEFAPEKLSNLADTAKRLSKVVNGIVWYWRPNMHGPEVADRFEVVDGKVIDRTNISVKQWPGTPVD
ncbi:hypothetical protein Q668_05405 [Alcanivorax sp. PN-3]|nr:hypothetical protein Q668_05405 [Alcanivorax sp. PN-3]